MKVCDIVFYVLLLLGVLLIARNRHISETSMLRLTSYGPVCYGVATLEPDPWARSLLLPLRDHRKRLLQQPLAASS